MKTNVSRTHMITNAHSLLPWKHTKEKRTGIELEGKENEGVIPHTLWIWDMIEMK